MKHLGLTQINARTSALDTSSSFSRFAARDLSAEAPLPFLNLLKTVANVFLAVVFALSGGAAVFFAGVLLFLPI